MRGNRSFGGQREVPPRPSEKTDWEGRDIKNYLLLRQQRKGGGASDSKSPRRLRQ